MNKKILIGGTGRSGTTILSRWLGSHRDICKIPVESRFILDKGGLIDLFYSLTKNYSIAQSRAALQHFYDLMMYHVNTPYHSPYLWYDFFGVFGEKFYRKEFSAFFDRLHCGTFVGSHLQTEERMWSLRRFIRKHLAKGNIYFNRISRQYFGKQANLPFFDPPEKSVYIARYFSDEGELLKLMGCFVNNLFYTFASRHGKNNWCEDTPANVLHLDFLKRLFDQAYFIHIVRNPIGVAYSMTNQTWAPKKYDQTVAFLSNIYEKLITANSYAKSHNIDFIEIKLEDLNRRATKNKILRFLDLDDDFDNSVEIDDSKINYWKSLLSSRDEKFLRRKLCKYMRYYRYC